MLIEEVYGNLPVLETDRLILRKLRPEDEKDVFDYCSDEEVSKYTTWGAHQTIEDTRAFLNFVFDKYQQNTVAPWGVEDKASGRIIGTTGYMTWDTFNSNAEIGYALSRAYWGKGYMSEAVRSIIDFGFDVMDLVRIEARCLPSNIGSSRVMEKSGMSFEGILRKYILFKGFHEDIKMYSILKDERESS